MRSGYSREQVSNDLPNNIVVLWPDQNHTESQYKGTSPCSDSLEKLEWRVIWQQWMASTYWSALYADQIQFATCYCFIGLCSPPAPRPIAEDSIVFSPNANTHNDVDVVELELALSGHDQKECLWRTLSQLAQIPESPKIYKFARKFAVPLFFLFNVIASHCMRSCEGKPPGYQSEYVTEHTQTPPLSQHHDKVRYFLLALTITRSTCSLKWCKTVKRLDLTSPCRLKSEGGVLNHI
jgi:hypothetical protein